MIAFDKFC